jgi:signal transduction histidine kinase/DNA-binding response OmpR family regulator
MVPYNDQTILIGTETNGLYLFNGCTSRPFPTKVDDYLKDKQPLQGIRLSTGEFALATKYGGLVIIDAHGRLKEIFNKSYGLQDDEVHYVFQDLQGNLWLALGHGISKIEYTSPVSINDNLTLNIFSIIKHHNILYVGTEKGLFSLSPEGKFLHVPGTSGPCFSLLSIDDSIFAATINGVFQVGDQADIKISGDYFYYLLQSSIEPNRIWVGGANGLFSLYKQNGKWEKEHKFEKITQRVERVVEDKKGNLWLGVNNEQNPTKNIVLKVDFPGDGTVSSPVVTGYDITGQVPAKNLCYVFRAAGHVIFSTEKGLLRFDEKNKVFIPDLTFGKEFAGDLKTKGLLWLDQDKNKNVWLHTNTRIHMAKPQADGSYVILSKPFLRVQSYYWFPIYPDPHKDITWIGGKGYLIRYDRKIEKNYDYSFQTLIRRAEANGKLVFGGYKTGIGNESNYKGSFPLIAYENRNLSFEFAAPFFEDESKTQYQCFLEGYESHWSALNWETRKNYTNLDPGLYTFRVRAKNVYGNQGSEAVFQFKILPPWYRTWWAFLSYALVLFMLTYLVVKWRRSIKLEQEKHKLEQIVAQRTMEIKAKSRQLEQKTIQLEEQSEKLKELDNVKSRFFANISHEFRTPLTLIMGPLEQMLSKIPDKEAEKKLNLMLRNSRRLLALINQLLELSKLDSGTMKLQAGRQNIVPFLKSIAASFEPVAEKKQLDLTLHCEAETIILYYDPQKLEEVMLNLLSNAVKFTPARGKITVTVQRKTAAGDNFPPGWLEVSVCDTGIGIPGEQLPHIFDRFYQSDRTHEHHGQGSGIGLAIAKELVELHRGEIAAQNRENKGTEFIIRLPLGDSHLKPEEIVDPGEKPYRHKSLDEIPALYMTGKDPGLPARMKTGKAGGSETAGTENNTKSGTHAKNIILVVEDNPDVRDYIRGALEPLYTVVEAKDGQKGIEKAQKIIPDLIISDIMMPETDGYELCRVLKKDTRTSHIPLILLTAKASEESVIQGLDTGADDYITKPFNTNILCARIKNLLNLRLQLQLNRQRQMTLQPMEISVSSVEEEFYKELQKVIEKNLSDSEFNVGQMRKRLYMSRATLYRKVMALTGESPQLFIRSYRLKRAAQLLEANYGNVNEVAVKVGFANTAYFSICFKEKFHQSPSSYQARVRSQTDL